MIVFALFTCTSSETPANLSDINGANSNPHSLGFILASVFGLPSHTIDDWSLPSCFKMINNTKEVNSYTLPSFHFFRGILLHEV